MPFSIVRDEIARQVADVVVVPANAALRVDGGAGLAVGRIAGLEALQAACDEIGGCAVGDAVPTPAFGFPARALVHAIGPTWDGSDEARAELRRAYGRALALAAELGARSIALPLISAGARGCPAAYSLHVALDCVRAFLEGNPEVDIRVVVFDDEATRAARSRFPELACYVDDEYVGEHREYLFGTARSMSAAREPDAGFVAAGMSCAAAPASPKAASRGRKSFLERVRGGVEDAFDAIGGAVDSVRSAEAPSEDGAECFDEDFAVGFAPSACVDKAAAADSLGDMLDALDAPFSTTLLAIIDDRGLTDAEVYRRANLSRQHFSKIRSNPAYQPTKKTVLALAVALELSLDETRDLLERAGFALSHASKFDIVIEWFIEQGNYDIFEINEALYSFDQPILG